jgi:integration host factor subunit alpha
MASNDSETEQETLTKARIVDHVYDRLEDATKKETEEYVEMLLERMKEIFESGDELKVSGFGKFIVRHKEARTGRNPKTGEEVPIPERKVLRFKISPVFKKQLNDEREFEGF